MTGWWHLLWAGLRWSLPFVLGGVLLVLSGLTSQVVNLWLMLLALVFGGLGLWRQRSGQLLKATDALIYLLGFVLGSGVLALVALAAVYGLMERSFSF